TLDECVRVASGFSPSRSLLLRIVLVSLTGVPSSALMPIVATDLPHGGAHTLGFLMSALGVGALGGALYLAQRRSVRGLGQVIATAVTLFGLALIAFGLSRREWLSLGVLAAAGFGMMVQDRKG